MGIDSDLMVEFGEEEHEDNIRHEIAYRAAVYVLFNGSDRLAAIQAATGHVLAQHEAIANQEYAEDEDVITFYDPRLNDSPVPFQYQAQISAIQAELINLI